MTHLRKPVLMTGHLGYLGSVMLQYFRDAGYDVIGLDTGYYAEASFVPDGEPVPMITKDLRDVVAADLRSFYAVVHLGALSNDPIGNLDPHWTEDINHAASVRIAELAREAGVRRFIFSSSCIMYGTSSAEVVDEESPLDPSTEYARSKVKSEMAIRELASDSFSPTFLRNGTVYGVSPRMRFDTVLNDLTASAYTAKRVVVLGDGSPWRPVVHVEDVARSFVHVLGAPLADVHNQAFNNGSDHLNHQILDLARIAVEAVPGSELVVEGRPSADRRTYRASFAKFARTFPDFEWRWDVHAGVADLVAAYHRVGLTRADYEDPRYIRLRWLQHLIKAGRLDGSLRWTVAEVAR
jgi:nucleoside-diphosphate-sugar epimerase